MPITQVNAARLPVHHASLQVTGWLLERRGQTFVHQWPVQLSGEDRVHIGQRVTVLARPRTDLWGNLNDKTGLQRLALAPAHRPNGSRFSALGQLRRVDPSEQMIVLRTFRNGSHGKFVSLRVRATESVLRAVDVNWWAVQVRGGLVGRTLIADVVEHRPPVRPGGKWMDEWTLAPGVDLTAFPDLIERPLTASAVLRRTPAGRCYLNGRPLKGDAFEALLKAGYLWGRIPGVP
ncbi:hypothetical protein [Deinococcus depolymerans]|uniref:Uncharacterized protein n=1 Tax=Deinococcus depolymerans TaxID=392408 RepID=A0ABN1CRD1_9DEIO